MQAIYKYQLTGSGVNEIEMPTGARILSAQFQGKNVCLWALVSVQNKKEVRKFDVIGTGWELEEINLRKYIATVQEDGYVWHIFEAHQK